MSIDESEKLAELVARFLSNRNKNAFLVAEEIIGVNFITSGKYCVVNSPSIFGCTIYKDDEDGNIKRINIKNIKEKNKQDILGELGNAEWL